MQLTLTHIHKYEDDPRFSIILGKLNAMGLDISKLTSDIAALTAAVTSADNDFASLRSQIATLTATIAAGGTVTQSQIDALDATVVGAVTNLNAQVTQDAPPAAAASPAPVAAAAAAPAPTITTDAPPTA